MDLKTLITECTAYDFKLMLEENRPKSWLKSVSAFSNGFGGSLFYGVNNEGVVKGLDDVQHVCEAISAAIRDHMDPLPDMEMIPLEVEGLRILQLKVNEGHYTPYYYVGDGQRIAFVRMGDESLPATAEQMIRLVLKGSNRTFDSLRTDKRKEDHSFVMLANTFKERIGQDWDKKYLLSFGLVTDDGYLTNAGALFADDCWLSQSRLYCTRWDGLEKGDALNDAEFKGNVLLLLREAMAFAKASTRKGWEKLPNGRKNKPEYAERAVLEACVNHFIHRDYTVMGGEVHLDIYDDRIVATSPGGMYSGQQVQDVPIEEISSNRRNPVLADVMAQLDYMEKRGSGLKRICNETMALDGYRDELKPVFKSSPSQFITVIYSVEYKDAGKDAGKDTGKDAGKDTVTISKPDIYVLKLLKVLGSKTLTVKDMMEMLDLKGPDNFRKKYLNPAIKGGYIALLYPEKPRKKGQAYYLTDLGKALLERTQ
jgi:ATP-dependent DNA helicase RecG